MKMYCQQQTKQHLRKFLICLVTAMICACFLFGGLIYQTPRVSANTSLSETLANSLEGVDDTFATTQAATWWNGSSYELTTADDLRAFAYLVNNAKTDESREGALYSAASYELASHIDLSHIPFWVAIGTTTSPFTGNFDGQGFSIYGLTIIDSPVATIAETSGEETYRGFFGYVKSVNDTAVSITRLGLKDTLIKSQGYYVGSLVARAEGVATTTGMVTISECYNTGYVEGSLYVGGLVGALDQASVVVNSYNAPATSDLNRFETGVVNAGNIDVVGNAEGAAVGGIAGVASTSVDGKFVIDNCYNAAIVDAVLPASREVIERGAMVGDNSSWDSTSTAQRNRNFFLNHTVPGATTTELRRKQGATSTTIPSITGSFLSGTVNFEVDSAVDSNDDVPQSPSKVWQWASKTNNGLPYLLHTPQLVRINLDARVVKVGVVSEKEQITEYGTTSILADDLTCAVTGQGEGQYALKSDYFFVTTNQMISFETVVTNSVSGFSSFLAYDFYSWSRTDYANSSYSNENKINMPATTTQANASATVVFPNCDMTLTANYVAREYSVVLSSNDSTFVKEITTNGDVKNSLTFNYADTQTVTFSVTANSGYKVDGWEASGDSLTLATPNASEASVDLRALIAASFPSGGEEEDIPTSVTVHVTLSPEKYLVFYQSNREDCKAAGWLVGHDDTTVLADNGLVDYNSNVYLNIDIDAIEAGYEFSNWEYQIVDAAATPSDGAWTAIETSRQDKTTFVINETVLGITLNDGNKIYFRANFVEITYKITMATVDKDNLPLDTFGGEFFLSNEDGTASISATEFTPNQVIYIKIKSNTGYYFDSVVLSGQECEIPTDPSRQSIGYTGTECSGVTWLSDRSLIKIDSLNADTSFYVVFKKLTYIVSTNLVVTNVESSTTKLMRVSSQPELDGVELVTASILYGDALSFKVALEDGFEVVSVKFASTPVTEVSGVYTVNVFGSNTISVEIRKKSFRVTTNFSYAGNYTYSADASCFEGAGEFLYGGLTQIRVNVPEMFVISKWMLNGQEIDNRNTFLTLSSITEEQNVVVELTLKTSIITFGQSGDSSSGNWYNIIIDHVPYTYDTSFNPVTLEYGKTAVLQVANQYFETNTLGEPSGRNLKYNFAYWELNGKSVSTERTYTVTANGKDMVVYAVYRPAEVKISTNVYLFDALTDTLVRDVEAGSVSGISGIAIYGERRSLVASANHGYRFMEWRIIDGAVLTSSNVYTFTVDTASTFTAVFVKVFDVAVNCEAVEGSISGVGEYVVGDTVTLRANANKGFRFVRWTENGISLLNKLTPTITFTMPMNDVNLDAIFEAVYVIDYSVNDQGMGSVVGSTMGKFRENVTLQAVSANNCSFVGWKVDDVIISTADKLTISLNGDVKVEAVFKKNFDWNIIIVLFGATLFAVVMIYGAIYYIKSKEAQPISARALIGGKDDKDVLKKANKRVALRDEIAPVPTRRNTKNNIQPVPVRKITLNPVDHKGQKVDKSTKASNAKSTLKTEDNE